MRNRSSNEHIYAFAHVFFFFLQSFAGYYTLIEGANILSEPMLTLKYSLDAPHGC